MSLVEQHHVVTYQGNVLMVAQQMKNPLMGAVMEMPVRGEAVAVADLINAGEYVYGEGRSRRNVETPSSGTRRWLVRPDCIEAGQYIDIEDKLDMAIDPTSRFVQDMTMRVTRGWADRILGIRKQGTGFVVTDGGIMGFAREGKTPGAATPLPPSQTIGVNVGGASSGLNVAKLRAGQLLLNEADFGLEDDGDVLYCMIGPRQKDNLLAIAEASATPLNAFQIQQLIDGKPTMLMGMNWIYSNRLPKVGTTRYCPVWSKNNIAVGVWEALQGDIWNDTSAKKLPYARVWARLDAVRAQDKGVVIIECNEP